MKRIAAKYKTYANDVLTGKITACEYVRMACRRYLSYFERNDVYFDAKAVERVISFVGKLRHFTGSHAGKPFTLQPWQKFIIYSIYGWHRKSDRTRLVRNAWVEVGRKNGKTALVAALTLYHLIADGEANAQVILSATSAKQAALCFTMASNFLKPLDPKSRLFQRYRDTIKFNATTSTLEIVAADASRLDGKNASMFVCDEVHEFSDGSVYNVLQSSVGMREQPLGVCITTAGFDLSGWAYNYRRAMIELLNGQKTDDSTFAIIYTLDDVSEADKPEMWVKANPNLGVTVKRDYLEQQLTQATNNNALMTNYLTKLLNCWVSSSETWINASYIRAAQKHWSLDDMAGEFGFIGFDLSAVSDLTAVALLVPHEGKFYVKTWYFLPAEQLQISPNRDKYRRWANDGHLTITQGNVVDYDYIMSTVAGICQKLTIYKIGYDTWNSTSLAVQMTEAGLPIELFSMSIASLNRPTKELERLILSGAVVMAPNPVDNYCFENVVLKRDYNENCRPIKQSNDSKIDGVMAIIMALGVQLTTTNYGGGAFVLHN